jgi:hypothetical protein
MQSSRKSTRVLSALSMAAAAALTAGAAHAVPTLSLYYGNETSYGNSNNAVMVGQGYNALNPVFDTEGEHEALINPTLVNIAPGTTTPVTINAPVGEYLSLAIDAVLTGNANSNSNGSSAGVNNNGIVQPSFLGLSELGMFISSSDTAAGLLTPLASRNDTPGIPDTTVDNIPAYTSTALINSGTMTPNGAGANNVYNFAPTWNAARGAGNVAPNQPGFSGAHNQGGVGFFQNGVPPGDTNVVGFIVVGNTQGDAQTKADAQQIEQFSAQNNVANYANATDFFDNLVFQVIGQGIVTLSPFVVTSGTEYWTNTSANPSSTTIATSYAPSNGFTGTINNLPLLVINSVFEPPPGLVSYSSLPPAPQYGTQVGSLAVTGHSGSYNVSQVTGLTESPAGVGYVAFSGFNPGNDEQIFALDVLVNGSQATTAELATLVDSINNGDGFVGPSLEVVASTSSPVPDPFGSQYNLFLDPSGFSSGYLGFNFNNAYDSNLVGYSFSAIAVVPEPMSLGLLALGGVGLLARRHRPPTHESKNAAPWR